MTSSLAGSAGLLGGESSWDGDAPTWEEEFAENTLEAHLETTVDAHDVPTNADIKATVTIKNNSDRSKEVELRFRVREHVLGTRCVSVAAGDTRDVPFTTGGISNPAECK